MTTTQVTQGRPAPEHVHPDQVGVITALAALADPVRLAIVRELAAADDWALTCGSFDVPVGKAARSHHFTVLREAGVIEQRDAGSRRINRLRRPSSTAASPACLTWYCAPTPHSRTSVLRWCRS